MVAEPQSYRPATARCGQRKTEASDRTLERGVSGTKTLAELDLQQNRAIWRPFVLLRMRTYWLSAIERFLGDQADDFDYGSRVVLNARTWKVIAQNKDYSYKAVQGFPEIVFHRIAYSSPGNRVAVRDHDWGWVPARDSSASTSLRHPGPFENFPRCSPTVEEGSQVSCLILCSDLSPVFGPCPTLAEFVWKPLMA